MIDYSKLLSEKCVAQKPSGIRRFFDMLSDYKDVISLTVGQPDFQTPWHIRQAAIESLEKGKTYYTSNSGLTELRCAISDYLLRRFDVHYNAEEIIVTIGGSEAIDLCMRAVINPGDEVILPQPCYVSYEPLIEMAGGHTVIVNTREEDYFKLTPELLESAITERSKLLVLPYPGNPTGAIMTREDLEKIIPIIEKHNLLILSDEIYSELTYGKRHVSVASLDCMKERTILVSGFSKAYAMTGWRIGYTAAPAEITKQMLKLHQFAIMCAPTQSQFAAVDAMKNGDEDAEFMVAEYNRRRKFLVAELREMGIGCFEPEGAFYVFPNISGFGMSSEEFCKKLLEEYGVACVPGTAFGDCGEGFVRISYAYSVKHLTLALEKIEEFSQKYKKGSR